MKRFAVILPLLAGISWGTTGPFVRLLTEQHWNNFTLLFSRASLACLIMFIGMLLFARSNLKIRLKDIWIFLLGGLGGTLLLNICYQESINRLTLSLAAVLLGLSPIFVLFMAAVIFKEKLTLRKILCTLLAIFGCILVSGVLEEAGSLTVSFHGILIGVLSAFFYAVYSIMSRVAINHGYNPVTVSFYSLLFVSIFAFPLIQHQSYASYIVSAPAPHIGILLAQALCVGVAPYLLYNLGLAKMEAGKASILAAGGEPSAATVFGLVLFGEVPSVLSLTGLVIVIVALALLVALPEKRKTVK